MTVTDNRIKALLEKVEKQRSELGKRPSTSWQTNAIFRWKDNTHFNLNTINSPEPLVNALALILGNQRDQDDAAKLLGVAPITVEYNGYPAEAWLADFKHRLAILAWEDKKRLLEKTEQQLKSLVSEEAKTNMALDDLDKLLG